MGATAEHFATKFSTTTQQGRSRVHSLRGGFGSQHTPHARHTRATCAHTQAWPNGLPWLRGILTAVPCMCVF